MLVDIKELLLPFGAERRVLLEIVCMLRLEVIGKILLAERRPFKDLDVGGSQALARVVVDIDGFATDALAEQASDGCHDRRVSS